MTDIASALNPLLADYAVFYQKLRNYHWNVKGPLFFNLHEKFEELYLDAAEKVDGIAERILALGAKPHSTMAEFLGAASLEEDAGNPDANGMVKNLIADMEALRAKAGEVFWPGGRGHRHDDGQPDGRHPRQAGGGPLDAERVPGLIPPSWVPGAGSVPGQEQMARDLVPAVGRLAGALVEPVDGLLLRPAPLLWVWHIPQHVGDFIQDPEAGAAQQLRPTTRWIGW